MPGIRNKAVWSAIAFILLAFSATVAADEKPCTTHDGHKFYDLNPLSASTDYKFKDAYGEDYYINVCRAVVTDTWRLENVDEVAAFTRHDRGDFAIGSVNTTLLVQDGHPLLILSNGSPCPSADHLQASTAVRFICDTSVFGGGDPQLIAQLPPEPEHSCAFFVEWRTHYACPAAETGGPGGIVVVISILAIIGLMLYIAGGTLYNRYVLQLRGFDQIPRFSLCSMTDTLDFCHEAADRIWPRHHHNYNPQWTGYQAQAWTYPGGGVSTTSRTGGADGVPAAPEERESMMNDHEERDEVEATGSTGQEQHNSTGTEPTHI